MIQETKEQQQMYNLFRSFIYIFLDYRVGDAHACPYRE